MKIRASVVLGVAAACVLTAAARADEPPIIAKARARLGTEAALTRVVTLHFSGSVTVSDPKDPKKQVRQAVDIVLQKPDRERVTVTTDAMIDTTAVAGYEAWHRVSSTKDPTNWQQDYLAAPSVKRLRAQVVESVNFFRGCERVGGTVMDEGPAIKDGIACRKVAFIYAPDIVFDRYFDQATGRLVVTETANSVLKEQGELVVEGIRFPKSMIQVSVQPDGTTQTVVTAFDKVTINDAIPESYFDVPPLTRR